MRIKRERQSDVASPVSVKREPVSDDALPSSVTVSVTRTFWSGPALATGASLTGLMVSVTVAAGEDSSPSLAV